MASTETVPEPQSAFPILARIIRTGEDMVFQSSTEIPAGVAIRILEVNYVPPCKWCHFYNCDCEHRITCDKAGQITHKLCGVHECGCPRFVHLPGEHQ